MKELTEDHVVESLFRDREDSVDRVLRSRFGEAFERFSMRLKDRLRLQERLQKNTGEDEQMCIDIGRKMNLLDSQTFETVEIATRWTDFGKTGPADATLEQQSLIARMYAIEKTFPKPPHLMSLRDFLELSADPDITRRIPEHLETLWDMGLIECNVRQFINLHAQWTMDIIRDEPAIPYEAKVSAALHHILEGNNPDGLVDLSTEELMIPSLNRPIGMQEILTILLDKYQARRRFPIPGTERLRTHAEQIEWLRIYMEKYVALKQYPSWLREKLHACINVLEGAGPFSEFFAADREAENVEAALAAK